MNFLEPWGLLGLAALLPVVALYFLKLKREQRVVPSTLLWKKVIEDLQVNAPFQRLRYSLLLLLQLLLIAVIGFALARPFLALPGVQGQRLILLIDCSASMATRDEGPDGTWTRLEAAVRAAQEKLDDLGRHGEMCIVSFDETPSQPGGFTNNRQRLKDQLANLRTRDLRTRPQEAFATALTLADERPGTEIIVLSDFAFGALSMEAFLSQAELEQARKEGKVPNLEELSLVRLRKFRFVPFGRKPEDQLRRTGPTDNVGITAINARTMPVKVYNEKRERVTVLETQLFVQVENFSADRDVDAILSLSTADQTFAPKIVKLKRRPVRDGLDVPKPEELAGCREQVVLKLPQGTTGVVTAKLLGPKDSFPSDDEAWVVVGSSEGTKVLLVSQGSYFVEKALAAMKGVDCKRIVPDDFRKEWQARGPTSVAEFDAVVFENVAPPQWTEGGAVFLNVLPPLEGWHKQEQIAPTPAVVDWDFAHPVMRYVNFGAIDILKSQTWNLPKTARTLVEGPARLPLVAAYDTDRVRAVGVAFDLYESSWAFRPALPLFISNAVAWVSEVSPHRRSTAQKTGEPLPLPPVVGGPSARLVLPGGETREVQLSADRKTYFADTQTAGFYRLTGLPGGEKEDRFYAVNLADAAESGNAARTEVRVGGERLETSRAAIAARREIWHWLVLAAAAVLLIEWWVYHRRLGL